MSSTFRRRLQRTLVVEERCMALEGRDEFAQKAVVSQPGVSMRSSTRHCDSGGVEMASCDGPVDQLELEVAGERLALLGERAVYWRRERTVFVADLHCGKAATFRAASIPAPGGATAATLERLDRVLDETDAERLVVLGDLIHARSGWTRKTISAISAWKARRNRVEAVLIRGNHDFDLFELSKACGFRCVDGSAVESPFVLSHYPDPSDEGYVLAGHTHPGIRLRGRGKQSETAPCFWFQSQIATLPAFGEFTGIKVIRPAPGDRVFPVIFGEVIDAAAAD